MTNYVKVQNNQIVWGPASLPQSYTFKDGSSTGDFPYMDPSVIKAEGFLPVVSNMPSYDPTYQVAEAQAPVIGSDSVTYNWTVKDQNIDMLKGGKKNDVNNIMQAKIYSSVITLNGHNFTMTQNTMLMVNNMATLAANNPNWTGVLQDDLGNFVSLTATDITAMSTQGQARLADCMNQAAAQVANINALTTSKDVAEYNIVIS